MATCGEVPGQNPARTGSEDLDNLKCHLCLEDGNVNEAVGMCIDCNDYLCEPCYNGHTRPRPLRNHQLIDKEQMLQGQIRASTKDTCTEKCEVHEDEVIKYYCTRHCLLGCTACVTLGHTTCKDVHYIPHVAKELENNEEYKQAETRLKSALDTFKKVSENVTQNSEEVVASCAEAVESIREFRRSAEEALRQMEAEMIDKVHAIKAEQMKELSALGEKYRATQEELQSALVKVEALQNAQQNCSMFTEMMRMNERLTALESQIKEAMRDTAYQKRQIRFSPNPDTLETLNHSAGLGKVFGSAARERRLVKAKPARDIDLPTSGMYASPISVSGLVVLFGDKLVITDNLNNNIMAVSIPSNQMLLQMKLKPPSYPWDVTAISSNKVAVTVPQKGEVAIIAVRDRSMNIDRTLALNGSCYGVDYMNDKLAVSFLNPHKVQVLSLQGSVLHTLSSDQLGSTLFDRPYYLTYGHDGTTLYVSNFGNNSVVYVKLDGTVVATYIDNELRNPRQPIVTSNGDVLVCGQLTNTLHQITKYCKKVRVLLSQTDGLSSPQSICLSEKNHMIYVGMHDQNIVKVFTVGHE